MARRPRGPIETKLFAGVGGVAVGKPISDALLWVFGVAFWDAPSSGVKSDVAGGFVPLPWRNLVEWLVPVILGAAAYYWAPHTHRPDLAPSVEMVEEPVEVVEVESRSADVHEHPTGPMQRVSIDELLEPTG